MNQIFSRGDESVPEVQELDGSFVDDTFEQQPKTAVSGRIEVAVRIVLVQQRPAYIAKHCLK